MRRHAHGFNPARRRLFRRAGMLVLPLALPGCGGGGSGGGNSNTSATDPAPDPPPPDPPPAGVAPSITSPPGNVQVREGQPATFEVVATGSAPLSYQWLRDGTVIPGATASSYTLVAASPADDGAAFTVRVSNAEGSVVSQTATLSVLPPALTVDSTTITVDSVSITVDAA